MNDALDSFFGSLALWLVASVVCFLIASGVADDQGRKDWNHVGPVPVGVKMLNDSHYLVANTGTVSPTTICHGSSTGGTTVAGNWMIPRTSQEVVWCYDEQSWNDHRAKSPNFLGGMAEIVSAPLFWTWEFLLYLLFSLLWLPAFLRAREQRRLERS